MNRLQTFTALIAAGSSKAIPALGYRSVTPCLGTCSSCGDPLGDPRAWGRCAACRNAAHAALALLEAIPRCAICGVTLTDQRRDAKTCGHACRQKLYRRRVSARVTHPETDR